MSRFSNLEFDPEFSGRHDAETTPVADDEARHLQAAQTAFEAGDFESALRSFARVLEHNPQNPRAWTGQVRMLIELDECREAKLWADKALERFPHEPELLAAKAVALARLGDFVAAMAFSDASFEERGDSAYLWLARADVLFAQKEAKADHCLDRARLLAPADWFLHWLISRIHYYHRRFVHALKAARDALALDASRFTLWLQAALCEQQLGLIDAAAASAAHAAQLNPRDAAARDLLTALSITSPFSRWRGHFRRLFSR